MQIFRSLDAIPASIARTVTAVGNFDGVHRGHQVILTRVRERARLLDAHSVALLFDPHPVRLLRPELAPKLITPLPQRLDLLAQTGLDAAVVVEFTEEFSSLSPPDFADQVLAQSLRAVEVHEGDNFRFGRGAAAGTTELEELGRELGFGVVAHPALTVRGLTVSSSQVRELIASGDMSMTRALLGRAFSIQSKTARGRGMGSKLTVPTINLAPYDELLPAAGVYVSRLRIGGETLPAVTNAGYRPTFGESDFSIESHLLEVVPPELDLAQLIEGTPVELCFLARIREEGHFASAEALKAQIMRDAAHAQRYFRLMDIGQASTSLQRP
jgi:riboflavin kinase/FMN adenylyltransferase